MTFYVKDPDADKDYDVDWREWLASDPEEEGGPGWQEGDDTIVDAEWIVPDGITEGQESKASSFDDTRTTIWLSGGELGEVYEVVTRVTTAGGRTEDWTDHFYIQNR